ncbi:MAG: diguanylate cyclase [Candidatus Omnitrophica bacterium]|nr:diguanylate cyclase [Candidatus Omnitrophota bacterium]
MKKTNNLFSIFSKNLKYKLKISLYLLLILPLLISIYIISSYWSLKFRDIIVLIIISLFIELSGFLIIQDLFRRLIKINKDIQFIASGELERSIEEVETDEIGQIAESINLLTKRIRDNLQQLRDYSQKAQEFDLKIQRRALVLSWVVRLTSLISAGERMEEILDQALRGIAQVMDTEIVYLLFKEEAKEELYMKKLEGKDIKHLLNIIIDIKGSIFEESIRKKIPFILDAKNYPLDSSLLKSFNSLFKLNNTLAIPLYSKDRLLAVLGVGNNKTDFIYDKEDIEFLEVFAKNLSLVIETEILLNRLKKLEIIDPLTGLYNDRFIRVFLNDEIKRGIIYHHPCGFILFRLDNFKEIYNNFGSRFMENILKKVSLLIKDSLSEIDKVGRFSDETFAVVLIEKNKRQALEIADQICKRVEFVFKEEEPSKRVTLSAAVTENPLDGVNADELIQKAEDLLEKSSDKNVVLS